MQTEIYRFNDLDELYKTADELPKVERDDVYARNNELDEWTQINYKDSLWTDDGRATGIVSSNPDFYNIIQYGDILRNVGKGVEQSGEPLDLEVHGQISLSPTAHRMTARIDFDGEHTTVWADENDGIDLGLKVRSGHSGYHALKYDVGAERQVCSNGMMAFVSDLHFEQSHSQPFQPGLAYQAVDAVLESPEEVEHRIQDAQSRKLLNRDESLLVLFDHGLDRFFENPVPDLLNALIEEVDDPDKPSLWETYNAATRALTHYTRDIPDYELDQGFEQAARLLETGYNGVPDPVEVGRTAVENRANQLIENPEDGQHWENETEAIQELLRLHGVEV